MNNKQKFLSQLEKLYVGAKLDGKGGMAKLLQFKGEYFNKINTLIETEITKHFPDSNDNGLPELYDKLYTFFSSYLTDGGSVYFNDTPAYKNVYSKVYFDKEDTALFYKTKDLYYVKSQTMYRSIENMTFKHDETAIGIYFDLDASHYIPTNNNTKETVLFLFTGVKDSKIQFKIIEKSQIVNTIDDNTTDTQFQDVVHAKQYIINIDKVELLPSNISVCAINYTKNADNKNASIRFLNTKQISITTEILDKAIKIYQKQTEVDFFIHKNAKGFLTEQFNLYMYNYLSNDMDSLLQQNRLENIRKIKQIAFCVIDYIAKFEDELKAIWNKPKFVRNSNYVITMDKLIDKQFDMAILTNHTGIKAQIKEWLELGIVDTTFKIKDLNQANDMLGNRTASKYKYVPFDTKHFDIQIKYKILSLFDNLDDECNGVLIKSENWQALNTIMPKYNEKIDLIYIDPPFNLGTNADYQYNVDYKDSTWATILENRMKLAKNILNNIGSMFVRCDYNGNYIVRNLLNNIFGSDNFKNEVIVSRGNTPKGETNKIETGNDSLFYYRFNNSIFNVPKIKRVNREWQAMHLPGERMEYKDQIRNFGENIGILLPPKGRHWAISQDLINARILSGDIKIDHTKSYTDLNDKLVNKMPLCLQFDLQKLNSNWYDIPGYSSVYGFSTENSEKLLARVINMSSNPGMVVLDFFAGSATTQAVAHKLGRKWIGVEMGEQFYSIDIPRLKTVVFGEQKGISEELNPGFIGGGMFKYYELEQYEDVLDKTLYTPVDDNVANMSYDFSNNEKLASDGLHIDYSNENNPIYYTFEKLYPDVDIWETISNVSGWKIKQYHNSDKVTYIDRNGNLLTINRNELTFELYPMLKELIWW